MSTEPRPLLIAGNKRSGTSMLGVLLNAHPHLFVAHETDIVSALAQLDRGEPFHDDYEWDAPLCLSALVEQYEFRLREGDDRRMQIRALFFDGLRRILAEGTRTGQKPMPDKLQHNLRWLGDKKPVQYADPALRAFMRAYLPDARFLHIVRHPRACVASMKLAGDTWGQHEAPAFWRQPTAFVLERWTVHEEWVIAAEDEGWPVHTLRQEDLCRDPRGVMDGVCDFLEVDRLVEVDWTRIARAPNDKHRTFEMLPDARARRVMERYGYSIDDAS